MRQPPKRRRHSHPDFTEPRIIGSDTLMLSNYLAAKDNHDGDVILIRSEHLHDVNSLKKQLEAEKKHCLSVIGEGPPDREKLQRIAIINDMLNDPEASLSQLRTLHAGIDKTRQKPVTEQDIKDFLEYFKKWPFHIRRILEHHGAFMLSPDGIFLSPKTEHGHTLLCGDDNIPITAIDVSEIRNKRSSEVLRDNAVYTALENVIGKGPDTIDWKGADEEIQRELRNFRRKKPDFSNVFSTARKEEALKGEPLAHVMCSVAILIDSAANEKQVARHYPKAYAAYTQYNRYVHSMAMQVRSVDPDTIDLPEIPLLHDENAPATNRTPPDSGAGTPPPAPPTNTIHSPVPPDDLIRRAEEFATACLREEPPVYRLQCHLSLQSGHPIVLRLANHDDSDVREIQLTPNEPDLQRAIELKQAVQTHVLNMPGIAAYRKPVIGGAYNLGWDDIIPDTPPAEIRLVKANGVFKLELHYPDPDEPAMMGFSLGLLQDENNRQEAERRRNMVVDYLALQRTAGRMITKGDAVQQLRSQIPGDQWRSAEKMDVDGFSRDHRDININFPTPDSGQTTIVRISQLHVSGDPNPSWKLPLQIRPNNGFPVGVDINLHTLDDSIAQQRAEEIIAALQDQFRTLPQRARWALDHRNVLQQLTPAELAATSNIDATRLRDMLDDLPHYKDDLAVRVVKQRVDGNQVHFSLGILRGANTTQNERVMEKIGNSPQPVVVERQFIIPLENADRINAFERAVNDSFLAYVREEYRPHTDAAIEHDGVSKRKKSLAYNPRTAPLLLDDAIQAQRTLNAFPEIQSLDPARINRGRGQWRDIA